MNKNKNTSLEKSGRIIAIPYEEVKDPKTGKTISRKNSMIMAGGAVIAGTILNDQLQNEDITEIFPDDDTGNTVDAISSDSGTEDNYGASVLTPEEASEPGNEWNPNEAPMAGPETIREDMSFTEAFAAARDELGAGGVFAWQGNYYNTFYAEELDENNQPVVDFQTTDHHDLPEIEYQEYSAEDVTTDDMQEEDFVNVNVEEEPFMMAADMNSDGIADAVFIDINQDGSADAMYVDQNQDGQLTEDELIIIHDPDELEIPGTPADGTTMSVDLNADGTDEVLFADVNYDQVADIVGVDENNNQQIEQSEITILNPDAMDSEIADPSGIEYSGEVSDDIPEDVPDEVLESMEDDLANLEDNFDEINDWS